MQPDRVPADEARLDVPQIEGPFYRAPRDEWSTSGHYLGPERTEQELRWRITAMRIAEERMDRLDWLGRQWVAEFAAHAATVADELERRLDAANSAPAGAGERSE